MLKKSKVFLSKLYNKTKEEYKNIMVSIMTLIIMSNKAYANPPKIVTGTVDLFTDVSNWLLILIPVVAGAFFGYFALKKSATEDDAVIADMNKKMKNTIISAVIAETGAGIVRLVLGYYS